MCVLVLNQRNVKNEGLLVNNLIEKFPNIKTIVKNINLKKTNVILGNENINIFGNGYIYDKLGDFTFKISPNSFYQVNPVQTELLYNLAIEQAKLNERMIVFDLYCGVGTIGIFASKYVKKVYGIEIVEDAIEDANENAKMNGVKNTEFICGDVELKLKEIIEKNGVLANVVFVDPPRKGLDNSSIKNLMNIVRPEKIIYISCNPSTLVRDLAEFERKYEIKSIVAVDMFPFTSHVECVTVLYAKETL